MIWRHRLHTGHRGVREEFADWDFEFAAHIGTMGKDMVARLRAAGDRREPIELSADLAERSQAKQIYYALGTPTKQGAKKVVKRAGSNN